MQKYKIVISDLAEQDLEFAADYIAYDLKNPSAAVNTVRGVRKQINKFYYVVENDVVIIVRILHMLVDSKAWLYRTFGLKD